VLVTFGFSPARFSRDIMALVVMMAAYGAATFALLKFGELHLWDLLVQRVWPHPDGALLVQTPTDQGALRVGVSDLAQPLLAGTEPQLDDTGGDDTGEAGPGGTVLEWQDMSCSIRAGWWGGRVKAKTILHRVSGLAGAVDDAAGGSGPGDSGMFGILGPSGAGKTTLLDILAGRLSRGYSVTGTLHLDGAVVTARDVSRVSGYVPQDDVLPGTSTVFEYLTFHAELRLPRSMGRQQRRARVHSVLSELGLGKVGSSLIGDAFRRGLSGGEKRRLSLAVELLSRPRLLFVDEATTGLDSTNAAKVVDILAGLCRRGVTCVLSIHQPRPDMFRLLTRVLVLSGDGAMVFSGPSHLAGAHFSSLGHPPPAGVNVADYMLDTVLHATPDEVARLVDGFRSSEVQGANALLAERAQLQVSYSATSRPQAPSGKYTAGYGLQLRMLCGRLLRNAYRHPLLFWLQFGATLAVALCLGVVFAKAGVDTPGIQDRLGSLFFMLLYLSFMTLSSLPVWREERLLFLRERAAGAYGTAAYFTAVVLFDILPLRVVPPVFFLLSYFMIGLRHSCGLCLFRFAGTLALATVAASSACMLIGILAPSHATANVIGSLVQLTSALLSGFFVQTTRLPGIWRLLSLVSPMRLAFDALCINEFHGATGFAFTSPVSPAAKVAVSGDGILATFGYSTSWQAFEEDMMTLSALVVTLLVLCLALLTWA
jgi:ABC-type multidrug transport system ATPase subunit